MAFTIINPENKERKKVYTEFFYDFSTRFVPITLADVKQAKSVSDFLMEEELQRKVTYNSVDIIMIINDKQTKLRENGHSNDFTPSQIELLQSMDYASNFLIRAEFEEVNAEIGEFDNQFFGGHYTVVPEKQAVYIPGKEAINEYFEVNNKENTVNLQKDKLQVAKLYFTVTKNGAIENVQLDRTSGSPKIDKSMIELATNLPGKWVPAENSEGEKMDQEFVVTFGIPGC